MSDQRAERAALYDRIAALETRLQRAELGTDTLRERLRASEAYVAELRVYLCAEPALHCVPPTREETP